jgi:hypothetical protein
MTAKIGIEVTTCPSIPVLVADNDRNIHMRCDYCKFHYVIGIKPLMTRVIAVMYAHRYNLVAP